MGNLDTTARWKSRHPNFVSGRLVLLAKHHARCVLWKSKLAQIALVGPRIHLQKSQRDKFTRELP